jgi:hypothetical protein
MVLLLKRKSSKALKKEVDDLIKRKSSSLKKHSWNKFFGKVSLYKDPVSYQRSLRDE